MAYVPLSRNNYSTAAPGEDLDADDSRSSSPGLPPPPPPLHISAIPARLSFDHHRDNDGGGGKGAYDLSSVLSVVQRLDSRNGRDGSDSGNSYELVSRHDEDGGGYFGSGAGTRQSSGVLVDRYVGGGGGGGSTPASPLVGMNHGRDDASQLDGGLDRAWQCVSVGSDAVRERQAGADEAAPRGNYQRHDNKSQYTHHALRSPTPHEEQERPHSAGDFFKDFDGVHYSAQDAPLPPSSAPPAPPHIDHHRFAHPQRASVSQPRLQPRATLNHDTHSESSRDSGLVFYPAPVPAILNLPPLMAKDTKTRNRLSRVQKRASQQVLSDAILTGDPSGNNRRSVAYDALDAPNADAAVTAPPVDHRKSVALDDPRRLSHLPPALRASAFFDSMNSVPTISPELKEASAVATLDSILDASANAPPAAFTDHPMTGTDSATHLAAPHRNEYRNSVAMTVVLHPGESPRSSMDGGERDDSAPLRTSRSFEIPSSAVDPAFHALPTTLLAELESRKMQQKSRNRTAASAFPTGIRSTLLELDAVAQVQAQSRRAKRTTLAWEDPEEGDGSDADEDVPLGLLYQGQTAQKASRGGGRDEDVPLGLLMQKAMEDSEPLSRRRDRLRQQNGGSSASSVPVPKIPPLEETEEEEETLAQRLKRLREKKDKRASAFGDGSLELCFDTPTPPPPPPEDETLAQRRKRLRGEEERRRLAEEAKAVQAEVRKRNNMSTLLNYHHLGAGVMGRGMPMLMQRPGSMGGLGMGGGGGGGGGLIQQAGVGGTLRPQMSMGNMTGGGMGVGVGVGVQGMGGIGGYGGYGAANGGGGVGMGMAGMGGMGMMGGGAAAGGAIPMTPQEIAMNNKQREMVERWRASVM